MPLTLVAPVERDEAAIGRQQSCAADCLAEFSAADSALLGRYHSGTGRQGIAGRGRLAEELGVAVNALRIRAFRLRRQMRECMAICLAKSIRNSDKVE